MTVINENYDWNNSMTWRNKTSHLILHHAAMTAASAQDIHRIHSANGWTGIGYHYYVRKNGMIFRGRPEGAYGAHTTGMNAVSIGVCFEGNFETEDMPDAQLQAGQELIADIKSRYPSINVTMHKQHNATACPGQNFRFSEVITPPAILQEASKEEISLTKAEVQQMINSAVVEGITTAVARAVIANKPVVYNSIDDVPEWGKTAVQGLLDKDCLQGDGQGLGLSHDMLRMIVLIYRMGLCDVQQGKVMGC